MSEFSEFVIRIIAVTSVRLTMAPEYLTKEQVCQSKLLRLRKDRPTEEVLKGISWRLFVSQPSTQSGERNSFLKANRVTEDSGIYAACSCYGGHLAVHRGVSQ